MKKINKNSIVKLKEKFHEHLSNEAYQFICSDSDIELYISNIKVQKEDIKLKILIYDKNDNKETYDQISLLKGKEDSENIYLGISKVDFYYDYLVRSRKYGIDELDLIELERFYQDVKSNFDVLDDNFILLAQISKNKEMSFKEYSEIYRKVLFGSSYVVKKRDREIRKKRNRR